MITCYCCERRLGHSLASCDCAGKFCPTCLLCKAHCSCREVDQPFITTGRKESEHERVRCEVRAR